MKNITDNIFLNPFWLQSRLTFHWWQIIPAIIGAGVSLWGQKKQKDANNKAIDEANRLEQERWEKTMKLSLEANRLENARKLISYARDSGYMGGNQADFTKAKNNFHRSRLATLGYLPKLDMDDPDVKQAIANVGVGASPHDVYNELDRIAFDKWADGLNLDHRFGIEGPETTPARGSGGPPAKKESSIIDRVLDRSFMNDRDPDATPGGSFAAWRNQTVDPRSYVDHELLHRPSNPGPTLPSGSGSGSGNFNFWKRFDPNIGNIPNGQMVG